MIIKKKSFYVVLKDEVWKCDIAARKKTIALQKQNINNKKWHIKIALVFWKLNKLKVI